MNTKQKTIFIHVGTHKTGTTSIQRVLAKNTNLLEKHGYYYLIEYGFKLVRKSISSDNIISLDKEKSDNQKVIADATANQLIISSEGFSGTLFNAYSDESHMVQYLHYLFGDYNVKIIVYLRRQDLLLESAYTQSIHRGNSWTFKEFTNKVDIYGFDWYSFLIQYSTYFGKENLIVRPYEIEQLKDGTVVSDFFSILNIPWANGAIEAEEWFNRGYDRSALYVARICNRLLDGDEKVRLRRMLQRTNVRQPFEHFSFFSPNERRELINYYDKSNSEVAKTFLAKQDGLLFLEPIPEKNHYTNELLNGISTDELAVLVMNIFLEQDKTIRRISEAQNPYTIILVKEMENLLLKLITKLKMRRFVNHVYKRGINFIRRI